MYKVLKFFIKPYRFAIIYGTALALFFTFVLLNTFAIPHPLASVSAFAQSSNQTEESSKGTTENSSSSSDKAVITNDSYSDSNIQIKIETVREYDTTVYIADVQVSDISYLKAAFAQNTFGRNITETTSDMAAEHNAIFAINGDYYGFKDSGFVLRNGEWYRNSNSGEEDLMIDSSGNFSIFNESDVDINSLSNPWQILSFGPALLNNGEISVDENTEIAGRSMSSNPRTAIGEISPLHYIFIVSEGRMTNENGLSLYQLASVFKEYGCTVAYNLDGGGSATMIFNGEVINSPVGGGMGNSNGERKVSDIVYIGYE